MSGRGAIFAAALALCAAQASAAEIWLADTTHLAGDRAAAQACISRAIQDERRDCRSVIQQRCRPKPAEAATNAAMRQCAWRAIAAWEDEMAARLADLAGIAPADVLEASQRAWEASMLADTRLASAPFEGGSLQGLVAGTARAEALTARTLWLARLRRDLEP